MVFSKDIFPEGVEDLYCKEYEFKEKIVTVIKNIFKSFGYNQIVTPSFEYYDLYNGIDGVLPRENMLKLIDNSGRILVLRPDATIPVARMAATNYKNNKEMLKLSYVTNIFRANKSGTGDKREFIQGGIEYFGNNKPDCDAEIIAVGIKCLLECGFKDFHVDLGQVEFMKGLIDEANLNKFEKLKLHNLIENKNYGDLKEFLENTDITSSLKEKFYMIPKLYGKPKKVLDMARELVINEKMDKALNNLEDVYNILKDYDFDKYILFDLGFTKEQGYYTGIMLKGYVNNFGEVVLSGGRYDNLTKQFGANKPACGFGLNINKIIEVMEMYDMKRDVDCFTDYLVLYKENFRGKAIKLSQNLRDRGFVVETNPYENDIKFYIENSTFRNTKKIIEVEELLKVINIYKNDVKKYNENQFYKDLDYNEIIASIH
ncbi:ATP phosphoribosyltransferase regulatory subunit [Paramaledivibacter caminithermalis]|jgi:ATP phosphoribosyltransferase regulatory subunit|uniref:ATP phosphoribosyltransferase regulatory subunit n=1 Tax=Paramaledivibacter caminithermalis (strain DSM 15212 / CIP 107654 / DViRD3) TaxID=1121301 RepID=A0A1M6K969_PARC5|nr:ATP phosphoribosyltransferase regulatory subunit [Paramaledivibacter caminithermalis]SHJ55496.1 ATP phosphoribosyltransferase regulatory subunit [Paramaledivibacter caminithermalis DSM 15212]